MQKYDFNFMDIVENAQDVIIVTKALPIDPPGPEIVYVNKAFTELTGYSFAEVVGKNPRILQSRDTDRQSRQEIRQALIDKKPIRTTLKNYSKSGKAYWLDLSILPLTDDQGDITHYVAIERDVTQQKMLEKSLNELTRTDALTDIFNRRAFDEILEAEFSRFKRTGDSYSLLMLDIDHFKAVNDNYGHSAGDQVLKEFARACQSNTRNHDTVSRLGGEEFCILLPDSDANTAAKIAEKLRQWVMYNPIVSDGHAIALTVSIGVSEIEQSDMDSLDALKRADVKLYKAKQNGRNRVEI